MLGFLEYLLEKDEDEYYYHVTRGSNMQGIGKEGLKRKGIKTNYKGLSKKGVVYLTNKSKRALAFAGDLKKPRNKKSSKDNSVRLIRVHKSKIDPALLKTDNNAEPRGPKKSSYSPSHFEYHGDIPSKDITFAGGKHFKKYSKAWNKIS